MPMTKSAFLALLAVLLIPLTADAVPIVDQEHFVAHPNATGGLSGIPTFGRAQTFTVGLTGLFHSLDVQLDGGATQARILATSAGAPIGGVGGSTVLAVTHAVSNVGDVFTFDFSASRLAVDPGDVLAIELIGDGAWWGVNVIGGGSYSAGSDYFFNTIIDVDTWSINQNLDWNFRTYIQVSEPPAAALLGLGILAFGFARRRSR